MGSRTKNKEEEIEKKKLILGTFYLSKAILSRSSLAISVMNRLRKASSKVPKAIAGSHHLRNPL